MTELKPNHLCKNPNCTNGHNGSRKHYYACDYCGKTQNWRSMACSMECYTEYLSALETSRATGNIVPQYPDRTDMTKTEVTSLINDVSLEEVKKNTLHELEEYKNDIRTLGLGKTIDKINKEMDFTNSNKGKNK